MKCIFCESVNNNPDALIISKDKNVVTFLDKFPRTRAHMLIAPKQHFRDIYSIPKELKIEIFNQLSLFCDVLKEYGAKGINIGSNIGALAGQQVPHFHIHLIPRYEKNDAVEIEPAFKNTPWDQKSLSISIEEMKQICHELRQLYRKWLCPKVT